MCKIEELNDMREGTVKQIAMMLLAALLITGCSSSIMQEVSFGEEIVLKQGSSVFVGDEVVIRFVEVAEDSRCPVVAECVWEGDADVRLTARFPGPVVRSLSLHTHPDFTNDTTVYSGSSSSGIGVNVELLELSPYPDGVNPISQDQYRARLVVTRSN